MVTSDPPLERRRSNLRSTKNTCLKDQFAGQMHMRTLFSQKQLNYQLNGAGAAGKYIDFVI